MPAITDRSTAVEPVLKTRGLNHGTLGCVDLARTRKFYEEVLGLTCTQSSPISMMAGKPGVYAYAVVEAPGQMTDMHMLNHNGLEVETAEEVDAARAALMEVKDEWDLKILPAKTQHGQHCFYFRDFDKNWWEVVAAGPQGYQGDFQNPDNDLTGAHQFDHWADLFRDSKILKHLGDPDTREELRRSRQAADH